MLPTAAAGVSINLFAGQLSTGLGVRGDTPPAWGSPIRGSLGLVYMGLRSPCPLTCGPSASQSTRFKITSASDAFSSNMAPKTAKACSKCGGHHAAPRGKKCQHEADGGEGEETTSQQRILDTLTSIEQRLSSLETQPAQSESESDSETDNTESAAQLQRQLTKRLQSLGVRHGSDEDDDCEQRGTSRKKRAKSGRVKTSSDFIKVEVEWPHYHVYRGAARKPAAYDELNEVEFVQGYLATAMEATPATKDPMLLHLRGLMMDAAEFSFEGARNCHGIVLQHLEQGRLTWADTDKLVELRRTYAQRRPTEPETVNKSASSGRGQPGGQTPLSCLNYQDQGCSYSGDHQTSQGQYVKHACAHCLQVTGNTYRHPEQQCRRKQYGEVTSKNDEL
jgi:hypothetical protein